jgi:hypothetical protein
MFGLLLRPNGIFAAPVITTYVIWPRSFDWLRAMLLSVPAIVAGLGLIHLMFYEVLGAQRHHVTHAVLVFDLGGITHFTGENQFPVHWSEDEASKVLNHCYDSSQWIPIGHLPPVPS